MPVCPHQTSRSHSTNRSWQEGCGVEGLYKAIQWVNLFVAMGESAHLAGHRVVIQGNLVPEDAYSQQKFGDGHRTKVAVEGIGMDRLVVLVALEGHVFLERKQNFQSEIFLAVGTNGPLSH